ncbi:MAG: glycosyltransferase [Anaerolineae bacterium]|nr:glycosyltransferase [Anaerolineae bacterium]
MKETMEPGRVSVMMPAYNAEQFIAEALDSLLAQSYSNWELIVVDDGSADATGAIVTGYDDPRIRLITQPNRGEAAARNVALARMRGEFIAFLDADDLFLPHHLQATVGYLQSHPEHAAVYSDGYHMDEQGARLKSLSSRRRGPFEGDIFEQMVRASDVFGPPTCVLLRREPVVAAGLGFDEQIVIGPDWDFLTQCTEIMAFGYVDTQSCLYRVHRTNVTRRVDAQRRAGYLARCREKAIGLRRFASLPAETRVDVFYDLLVNLLPGQFEAQARIVSMPAFRALPVNQQARLYRLMARQGLLAASPNGRHRDVVRDWFERARELQPDDRRAGTLSVLYDISPTLCRRLLAVKQLFEPKQGLADPLADLR